MYKGHGVDLHYQPITFMSGSRRRRVPMSVKEVSLYFLGGDPIPYILSTPGLVAAYKSRIYFYTFPTKHLPE